MRSNCILCGASFASVERAPQRCRHTRSGFVASRKNWCVGCDGPGALVAATKAADAERRERNRDAHRAYMREYNATRHDPPRAQRFKCTGCNRYFGRQRESRRKIDGAWKYLGMCRFCAEIAVGPSKHDLHNGPRGGWAAYHRTRRARQAAA